MLGFVAAVAAELSTGRTVVEQVKISPGPIAAVFALFSVASLIPILKVRRLTHPHPQGVGCICFVSDALNLVTSRKVIGVNVLHVQVTRDVSS